MPESLAFSDSKSDKSVEAGELEGGGGVCRSSSSLSDAALASIFKRYKGSSGSGNNSFLGVGSRGCRGVEIASAAVDVEAVGSVTSEDVTVDDGAGVFSASNFSSLFCASLIKASRFGIGLLDADDEDAVEVEAVGFMASADVIVADGGDFFDTNPEL